MARKKSDSGASKKKFNPESAMADLTESTGMQSFTESKYITPEDYLDTGCYALNRIISGNVNNGFPMGYLTLISGPSQGGKSYYAARGINSALKMGFKAVFIFDTEGGSVNGLIDDKFDKSKIKQILVPNADTAIVYMQKILDFINDYQEHDESARFLIVFDSIGGLRAKKLAEDASSGVNVQDVGSTPRKIGDLLTLMTIPCLKTHTPAIILSHTYESFSMTPTKVLPTYGGSKVLYLPSVSILTRSTPRKADKMTGEIDVETFYAGSEFTFFTFKNRFVRPFFEAKTMNNFLSGEDKYFGLFTVAEGYELIVRNGSMYRIPEYSGDKNWYAKDILSSKESEEIWDKLIPIINEKSIVDMAYGSATKSPGELSDAKSVKSEIESDSTDHMVSS